MLALKTRTEELRFIEKGFHYSLGVVLLCIAVAKIFSAAGSERILNSPDPVFSLSYRQVLITVAAIELGVAALLIVARNARAKNMVLAWLGFNLLLYRLGGWWLGGHAPCPCLGTLGSALPLSRLTIERGLQIVIAYTLIGSVSFLIMEYRSGKDDSFLTDRSKPAIRPH